MLKLARIGCHFSSSLALFACESVVVEDFRLVRIRPLSVVVLSGCAVRANEAKGNRADSNMVLRIIMLCLS